ncbi:heavy-metal-associated domain-containing protein [Campylobacter pinnipediorum]|uniref:heavy-metal-associated domain-containing protein n=1 Tax=Campylobacter pinnipediorum TaxID=1965231 RepID=UPI00084D0142|nr:heavy-metal-associated domain-containing protein [Campylobacter pinnipediorum]AQW82734.1 heavy-metal-associated domain protein, putative copper metallochaperone CopZ [Campylobacter pinnipediorum subsp. pinnipediorum]AQW84421.1 heavy-metal-associated domain protein, putative copper metallochaperone CopZ [Campylobacter pinnipediorum subsp. pinnipediorum]
MKKFEVLNINCQNCANTIKNALSNEFGDIEVDLSVEPKIVSVDLKNSDDVEKFKSELDDLGFEVSKEL